MKTISFIQLKMQSANFLRSESGATTVEYAFMLALIIGVAFVAIQFMGGTVADTMTNNSDQITNVFSR